MGAHDSNSLYRDAAVYDIIHTPGTACEVDGLLRIVDLFVKSGRGFRVLEPACGSGRYLRVLGGRGVECVGYDIEEPMLGYARRRIERLGLGGLVRVERASMTDFLGPVVGEGSVDFVFNLINTVRHLGTDKEMLEHLAQTALALRDGGVYALGVSTSAFGLEMPSEDVFSARRGGASVTQTIQYLPPESERERAERVISHIQVRTAGGVRVLDSAYTLRTYSHEQLHALIARSAMRLECVVNEIGEEIDAPLCGYGVYILRPE